MSTITDIALAIPIGSWHPLLAAGLRSLQLQSTPIELAILDASNDPRVTSLLSAAELNIAYYRRGPDGGQAAAIVEGWRNTQSSFVGWLNVDDILFTNSLKRLLQAIKTDNADVAYGDSTILAENGSTIGMHGQVAEVDKGILLSNCISQPSTLIRRSALEAIGGLNANLDYTMDWDIWRRLHLNGSRFLQVNEALSAVYWGKGTKTSQVSIARAIEYFKLVNASNGPLRALKSVVSSMLQTEAFNQQSRTPEAKNAGILVAADYNPLEIGASARSIPIINLTDSKKDRLEIQVMGSKCLISFDSCLEKQQLSEVTLNIPLENSVPPGHTVTIHLETIAAGSTRFLEARLV